MDPWQIAFIAAAVSLCLSLPRLWYTRGGDGDYGQRRKVAAIKVLREANPWMGIKEAKDYVEGLIGSR